MNQFEIVDNTFKSFQLALLVFGFETGFIWLLKYIATCKWKLPKRLCPQLG